MTSINRFTALLSALAFVLSVNSVNAAELTLRSNISIVNDIVTLGDLFENAGPVANKAVFRSPGLGRKGMLRASRIQQAARENGLNWLNPKFLDNIVIRREAQSIGLDEISSRIGEKLEDNYPRRTPNSQLVISLNKRAVPFVMRADAEAEIEIENIRYNNRSGRFTAIISGPAGSPDARRITYSGRATEVVEVPVLIQAIGRGQVIRTDDLETRKIPARRLGSRTVTEAADLIGMAARRSLRPNALIRKSDVEKPKIVKRNAAVSVIYRLNALHITFRGRALQDGALGETVTVLNPRSRRTIQAIVTAPNVVTTQGNRLRQTASLSQ